MYLCVYVYLFYEKLQGCKSVLRVGLCFSDPRSRSLFAVARPSVCLSVVCSVRAPSQAIQIFGNISMALGTLAIC